MITIMNNSASSLLKAARSMSTLPRIGSLANTRPDLTASWTQASRFQYSRPISSYPTMTGSRSVHITTRSESTTTRPDPTITSHKDSKNPGLCPLPHWNTTPTTRYESKSAQNGGGSHIQQRPLRYRERRWARMRQEQQYWQRQQARYLRVMQGRGCSSKWDRRTRFAKNALDIFSVLWLLIVWHVVKRTFGFFEGRETGQRNHDQKRSQWDDTNDVGSRNYV